MAVSCYENIQEWWHQRAAVAKNKRIVANCPNSVKIIESIENKLRVKERIYIDKWCLAP